MKVSKRKWTESRKWLAYQYILHTNICQAPCTGLDRKESETMHWSHIEESPKLVWEGDGRRKMT